VQGVTSRTPCECGAPVACIDTWHEALSTERADPSMAVWHTPLVCSFVLQHRSHLQPRFAEGQYRLLQLFVDQGIEAVDAVAREMTRRNRGTRPALDPRTLAAYEPLPRGGGFPRAFALSVGDLRDARGGFVGDGHAAYGARMLALAGATVAAWLGSTVRA